MRDLRGPVFFACRWRRDFDQSDVWLGELEVYGQNLENRELPVKQDGRLRAKRGKQGIARKTKRAVTGKTWKTGICP